MSDLEGELKFLEDDHAEPCVICSGCLTRWALMRVWPGTDHAVVVGHVCTGQDRGAWNDYGCYRHAGSFADAGTPITAVLYEMIRQLRGEDPPR